MKNMKFDYIVGNPPFGSVGGDTRHLKCLDMVYDKFIKKMLVIMPWGFVTKDTRSFKKYQIKFAPKLQYVKEIAGNNFEGTHMPSAAIYEFTNEETETTILEYISGNKIEKSDLTNVSQFTNYENEIVKYLENQGQQLMVWGGGYRCTNKSLNKKGIFDEKQINKLRNEEIIKNLQHLYEYKSKIFLVTNEVNGGMNGTFMSSKVGLIFNNVDDLIRLFLKRLVSSGYVIIILDSIKCAENCKTALKNPLLRFTCYKTQLDQQMYIKRVYKYIPAINWGDKRCLTDEGLLEMCGCPKDKAKEYAEYVKHYVEERDKEIESRKKEKVIMESKLSDKRKERRKHNPNLEISGTQEFFTPKFLCDEMLDKIPEEDWKDITKTFLDSTMGNGNFLVNIYERKLKWCNSINDSLIALKSIWGTELMEDNTDECRNRLYLLFKDFCDKQNLTEEQFKLAKSKCINILKHNIVCTDTFKWDYENWKSL